MNLAGEKIIMIRDIRLFSVRTVGIMILFSRTTVTGDSGRDRNMVMFRLLFGIT